MSNKQKDLFGFDLELIEFVAAELDKHNIPVLKLQSGLPDIGPGYYGNQEGFYFRHPSYLESYSDAQIKKLEILFPMGVGPYTVFLAAITEIEAEEDRIWPASIGLTVQYND